MRGHCTATALRGLCCASVVPLLLAVCCGTASGWPGEFTVTSLTICDSAWSQLPTDRVLRTGNFDNKTYVKAVGTGPVQTMVRVRVTTSITNPTGITMDLPHYGEASSNTSGARC